MAYSSIVKPTDYFNTKLYTGNGVDDRSITGIGFQPDWVWLKHRNGTNYHTFFDAARGATKRIFPNVNDAQDTNADSLQAFESDGFELGTNAGVNGNSNTFVAWNWKGGTTSGLSGGNITPSAYSYNATSGFGVYKYTGNGSADQTIPHGLGAKPQLIFYKRLDSSTNWVVQSNLLGNRVQLVLNGSRGAGTDSRLGASDNWDTTNFNVGTYGDMNANGSPHVAYVFCNVKGYCKIGKYIGNGNANGTFVYTGFKPAFVMIKGTSNNRNWNIIDNKRDTFNPSGDFLQANTTNSEDTSSIDMDFLSNGFKLNVSSGRVNAAETYIYMAIADEPLTANVGANGIPNTAR